MYETNGLCDGIPLGIHRNIIDEDIGAIRAQEDWKRFVGPLEHYKGSCSAKYSLIQIAVQNGFQTEWRFVRMLMKLYFFMIV